ncbi:butyrophilin subfamily 3 member A2-like isoform X2 [Phalacrocorax aristotelis]|uniref:butyrophilin subfamily 3 member A2-like isoform X2 n=1 Tax=Phalacrocorax aristotelis TaxID=126867 RepID=UPI003F4C527D
MVTSTSSHHPKLPLSPSCPPGLAGSPEPLPSCDSSAAPEPGLCKEHRQRHQNGVKPDGKVLVSSRPCLPRVTSALACAVIFSCAFLVPELEGAQFRVLGPNQPVTAVVGEDVVLPCLLSPRLNAENMEVLWFWSTSSIHVHYHHSGCDDYSFQNPQYRGRTELSKEGLSVGDVSLRILSARLSDEGQYRCLVQDGDSYEEASVELQVAVSGSSPLLSVEDAQDGGVRVRCRATGWYPKPEMVWRDVQGQQLPPVTQSDSQDQNGLFEVEKSIVIQRNAEQNVSCSVRNTRLPQEKEAPIYISDSIFPKDYPWKVAFFATLAACFASLVAFPLFISRLRAQQAHAFTENSSCSFFFRETCLGAAVEKHHLPGGRRYGGVGLCLSMGVFPCAAGGGCTSRWTRTRRTHSSSSRMVGRAYGAETCGKRCQITPRDTTPTAASWARRDSPPGDTSGMWMWGWRKEGSGHWGWPRSPRRGRGRSTGILETGSGLLVTGGESIGLRPPLSAQFSASQRDPG